MPNSRRKVTEKKLRIPHKYIKNLKSGASKIKHISRNDHNGLTRWYDHKKVFYTTHRKERVKDTLVNLNFINNQVSFRLKFKSYFYYRVTN